LSNTLGVPVVVVSKLDDQVEAINNALRDAGHAAHCLKIEKLSELEPAIKELRPELILLFAEPDATGMSAVVATRDKLGPQIPLLVAHDEINEQIIATAMQLGARDVVSLGNIERLQAVATRELRACRIENALERVMSSADQYKHELHSLKQVTVEAIADVQEGIVVNANPSWLELFGKQSDDDLTGLPIMDICSEADRPALKGALVACQKGKWQDTDLVINCKHEKGSEFPVDFRLEIVEHDGELAVRMLIAPTVEEDKTPISLVEQAIQRDQVTGFYNQQHFLHVANKRVTVAPSGGVRAMAYIQPDRFSRARQDVGLIGAESVISQFAQVLREYTQPTDIYGRFGGTMFAIMLERGTMSDVEAWGDKVLHAISQTVFEFDDRSTALTCSIGLCEVDSATAEITKLLTDAESACRDSRQKGGNQIQLSESSGAAKKVRQDDTIWVPRIRGALMENRLRLEHQPVAGLNSEISGAYDTLVRMLDDEGNTILPSEFMPVAERTGLSKSIDRWVIGASLSFCASSNAELVFVRLSRDSLLDETLVSWLTTQIQETSTNPVKICFEVDELLAEQHMRQTQELATVLRKVGFRFAIEHFGISDHALRILNKVPMEFVKIDGSLMQGLHKNVSVQTTVKELARQASENKIETIAERVQDANTMAVLWQLGISYIQGNYVQASEIIIEDTSLSSVTTRVLECSDETSMNVLGTAEAGT
jgi:diguanylate cyclase (GGDEF)-like protein/PAS domain S-box-containing protein